MSRVVTTESVPLRRNRRYQLLWAGSAISVLGTQISTLAFPLVILAMTGSRAMAGVVGAVAVGADVLMGLPAGALVDRWDRRRTLLTCETARLVALGIAALSISQGWASIPLFVVVAAIQGAGAALVYPIRAAAIRTIVPAEQLGSAFAQEEARSHAAALAGPSLGGVLFAAGRAIPFLADALSYLASLTAALLANIPRRPEGVPVTQHRSKIVREIRDGLSWLWQRKELRAQIAILPVMNVAGAAVPLLSIILMQSRGVGSALIGLVLSVEGVAGLLGAMLAGRLTKATSPGRLLLLIIWVWAFLVALLAVPFGVWWVAIVLGIGVLLTPALGVTITAHVAQVTPDAMMGRAMSTIGTVAMLFNPLGPLIAGLLSQAIGPTKALLAFAVYLGVCAMIATASPHLRNVPKPGQAEPVAVEGAAGRDG